jgi:hypothetical protein
MLAQPKPQLVVDVCTVVQGVRRVDQHPVSIVGPTRVGGIAMGDRSDLGVAEADSIGEEGGVDTPLVLAAASRAGAIDHGLSVSHGE